MLLGAIVGNVPETVSGPREVIKAFITKGKETVQQFTCQQELETKTAPLLHQSYLDRSNGSPTFRLRLPPHHHNRL